MHVLFAICFEIDQEMVQKRKFVQNGHDHKAAEFDCALLSTKLNCSQLVTLCNGYRSHTRPDLVSRILIKLKCMRTNRTSFRVEIIIIN